MCASEKSVVEVIWLALIGHGEIGHSLEVRPIADEEEDELEIVCSLCSDMLMSGSAIFVETIVKELQKAGIKVVYSTTRNID